MRVSTSLKYVHARDTPKATVLTGTGIRCQSEQVGSRAAHFDQQPRSVAAVLAQIPGGPD